MEPADIDPRLNRALGRLAPPRAPETLVPRVMQALESRKDAPWYRREWRLWPVWFQVTATVAGLAVVALLLGYGPSITPVSDETLAPARAVTNQVEPTVAALQVLWRVVIEPFMPVLFVVAMLMGIACVAIGLTLNYVVFGRTWQR